MQPRSSLELSFLPIRQDLTGLNLNEEVIYNHAVLTRQKCTALLPLKKQAWPNFHPKTYDETGGFFLGDLTSFNRSAFEMFAIRSRDIALPYKAQVNLSDFFS